MNRLVVIALLVAASRAQADPDAKAKAAASYADGEKLYAAARYLDAAEKFRTAFELDPDPVYLFNVAQAYRFGEDCVKSADFYKRFLDKVPDPPNVAKIRAWYQEQDTCAKAVLAAKPPLPVEPLTRTREGDHIEPAPIAHESNVRLYAGIGSATAGAVAIVIGVLQVTKLGGIESDRKAAASSCTTTNVCTAAEYTALVQPFDDDAHAHQRNGIIAFSVGGLALGAAVYLIATAGGSSEHAAPVSVALGNGGAMAYGSWRF